jgi:hypothetical protein
VVYNYTCEICGKEVIDKYGSGRFCSRSCANKRIQTQESNKKRSLKLMGRKIKRNINMSKEWKDKIGKSNKEHNLKIYEEYIKKWKDGEITGLDHYGSVSKRIKRYFREKYDNKCQVCGWNEINRITKRVPLELHHKDGDCKNNKEDNLEILCPNCHSLTSTFKALNKKSTRTFKVVYNKNS